MAATAKTPNYTEEMTQTLVTEYQAGKTVEELAEMLNRSIRSIRSKLVREGVYITPEKPVKAAKVEGPTKKELLNELEPLVDFSVDGLMGATKEAIASVIVLARVAQAVAETD
jgi:plasmid maintenance system antidote protein VapI